MLQPAEKGLAAATATAVEAHFDDLRRGVHTRHLLRRSLRFVLQCAIVTTLVFALFFRLPQVEGQSMQPSIGPASHVLINTLAYRFGQRVERGDVVAFEQGSGDDRQVFLKRVVGLPGDEVALRDGRLMVNGAYARESYVSTRDRSNLATVRVPALSLYVLGDNRAQSEDSRSFGPVPQAAIVGKVILVVWPLDRIGRVR